MELNLCGKLCDNITVVFSRQKKTNPKKSKDTLKILHDINDLLIQPDFETLDIYNHILNKFIQTTRSEYGFLATIRDDDVVTHASTNIPATDEVNDLIKEIVKFRKTVFHPRNHLLGVYSRIGAVIVIVCNKPTKYTGNDVDAITDILKSMCYLFLR
jgi:hypothetical protein